MEDTSATRTSLHRRRGTLLGHLLLIGTGASSTGARASLFAVSTVLKLSPESRKETGSEGRETQLLGVCGNRSQLSPCMEPQSLLHLIHLRLVARKSLFASGEGIAKGLLKSPSLRLMSLAADSEGLPHRHQS